MSATWSLYNGRWIKNPLELDVNNRAFLYGDGLFETMRTTGVTALFLANHVERLHSGMEFLQIPIVPGLSEKSIAAHIAGLLNRNKWFAGARVRLTVFRDASGRFTPDESKTSYVLTGEPLVTEPLYPFAGQGRIMCVFDELRKSVSPISSLKTLSSLTYIMAGMHARKLKCDDAFIKNDRGEIIETTNANVILLKNEKAVSPGVSQGALNGTMRKTVLAILNDQQWVVEERGIDIEELLDADEILLTNAIQGVVWVKGVGEQRYYFEKGKQISQALNRVAKDYIGLAE